LSPSTLVPSDRAAALRSAAALLFLALLPSRAGAQVTSDSAGRTAVPTADSTAVGYGDSVSRAGVDTSRGALPADSTSTHRDSTRQGARESVSASSAAPTAPVPADSVLSVACSSARPGTIAPGLLLVVFRGEATTEERSAAVTEAGGVSAGAAPVGGEYVRASATASSRDVADRLVLNPAVASISERSCPTASRQ
jgi:hypothetical protein